METNTLAVLENMPSNGSYTLFAPVNYAFENPSKPEAFMLANYLILGEWTLQKIENTLSTNNILELTTVSGMTLILYKRANQIVISNGEREIDVVFTDIQTEKNTMHVISDLW